jgi:hypothetical protein
MIVVRAEQLAALEGAQRQAAFDRAASALRACFPACAAMPAGELDALVLQGSARAESYGLSAERDVLKYLGLRVTFGADFDRLEWAAPTLADRSVEPEVRMQVLWDEARWRQAARG